MGRTEYHNAPNAPKANIPIPAINMLVVDGQDAILLQRRRDAGQWTLPGGAQDTGETAAQCAIRECLEETGSRAEIRQQYENTFIGRPTGGEPTVNDEADGVGFVQPADLDQYEFHPSMR
ncbi:NUDIX domain-containing protein [Kitasatospora purpeofusca]|uniref:NUDIX hydrolase n=1 Tax=Kitasatospora purpeofusca TaxID=67352 RepID=UPI0030F17258